MRAVLGGDDTAETPDESFAALGLPARTAKRDGDIPLWADNEPALRLFLSLNTQWRLAPSGLPYGLDYGALPATLRLLQVPRTDWPQAFDDLRRCEAEALKTLRDLTLTVEH